MPKRHFMYSMNFVAAKLNGCCFFQASTLFAVSSDDTGRYAIFSLSKDRRYFPKVYPTALVFLKYQNFLRNFFCNRQ